MGNFWRISVVVIQDMYYSWRCFYWLVRRLRHLILVDHEQVIISTIEQVSIVVHDWIERDKIDLKDVDGFRGFVFHAPKGWSVFLDVHVLVHVLDNHAVVLTLGFWRTSRSDADVVVCRMLIWSDYFRVVVVLNASDGACVLLDRCLHDYLHHFCVPSWPLDLFALDLLVLVEYDISGIHVSCWACRTCTSFD